METELIVVKEQILSNQNIAIWIVITVVIIIIIAAVCIWKARQKAKRAQFLQHTFDGQTNYKGDILTVSAALDDKVRLDSEDDVSYLTASAKNPILIN